MTIDGSLRLLKAILAEAVRDLIFGDLERVGEAAKWFLDRDGSPPLPDNRDDDTIEEGKGAGDIRWAWLNSALIALGDSGFDEEVVRVRAAEIWRQRNAGASSDAVLRILATDPACAGVLADLKASGAQIPKRWNFSK